MANFIELTSVNFDLPEEDLNKMLKLTM